MAEAPSLKRLDLSYSTDKSSIEELTAALKELPLLEDLDITISYIHEGDENVLGSVCQACPHLKKLGLMFISAFDLKYDEDFDLLPINGGITMMHQLRSLKLYDFDLSVKALNEILDNCPLLETLYVRGYFNKRKMDKELQVKCARVENVTFPTSGSGDHDDCSEDYNDDYSDDNDDYSEDDPEE